jgi:hypothetical protein
MNIMLPTVVHVASPVVSLTCAFRTFIILKFWNWEILKLIAEFFATVQVSDTTKVS